MQDQQTPMMRVVTVTAATRDAKSTVMKHDRDGSPAAGSWLGQTYTRRPPRSKVDGFVPRTQHVNLRIVCHVMKNDLDGSPAFVESK